MISDYEEIFEEYRERGEKRAIIEIVTKMKSRGYERAKIAAITGLSMSYISKLPKM